VLAFGEFLEHLAIECRNVIRQQERIVIAGLRLLERPIDAHLITPLLVFPSCSNPCVASAATRFPVN
jgi:hypothetical protein